MIRFTTCALIVLGLTCTITARAGEFNKVRSVGDAAPSFSGLPGTDDKMYGLSDFKKDVVVVIVTCNHCPIAVAYEDRIINLAKKFGNKIDVVAINVNNNEQDKLPAMKIRAKDKGFNFAYLYDASQKVGRDYGATVTPEFYVLGKDRKIAYMGAMDDNNNSDKVKTNYLEPAIEAALRGDKITTAETRARGCGVQYENK